MMDNLESIVAEALCGSSRRHILHPCTYHVAQAKLALNALAGAGMVVVPQDAEIAKYVVELADTVSCLKFERNRADELLKGKDADKEAAIEEAARVAGKAIRALSAKPGSNP